MPGLMESDTKIGPGDGKLFEETYDPDIDYGLVIEHSKFGTPLDPRTAYKENVCFEEICMSLQYLQMP